MAPKNTKILREIVQTYNRFYSTKSDIPSTYKSQELSSPLQDAQEFRYDVSGSTKTPFVPQEVLTMREPEQNIGLFDTHYLQPATYPQYISHTNELKNDDVWRLHKVNENGRINIQYPSSRNSKPQQKSLLVTETVKMNLIGGTMNTVGSRNYSTQSCKNSLLTITRNYVKKPHEDKCEKKPKKCQSGPCPRVAIPRECPISGGSDCSHDYMDPKCKKKMAPYASYSEMCARELEDDPSECFQCPWSKCGGADAIKPPKRNYHTSARPHNMAMIPEYVRSNYPVLCEAMQSPTAQMPGRIQTEEERELSPRQETAEGKCQGWTEAYALWCVKENIIPQTSWLTLADFETNGRDVSRKPTMSTSRRSPAQERLGVRRRNSEERQTAAFRTLVRSVCPTFWGNFEYDLKKCPTGKSKCPANEKWRCPVIDKAINPKYKPSDPCCEISKKERIKGTKVKVTLELAKEHDKGQPPPCKEKEERQPTVSQGEKG
ncbi:hypothetical protein NQ317_009374 [Molorchus minor]|uniref:Uncharacterized protein n=1 Tax=Molorchus minor TaxID=1323400 RepID=A0ABQ9JQ50_9CUCU|nr:hypothetical protein NQ317_009374 [Molorchus minor]